MDYFSGINEVKILNSKVEYEQKIGIRLRNLFLCALSKADLVYTIELGG